MIGMPRKVVTGRAGLSILDVVVTVVILLLLAALFMPVTRNARGAAARSLCKNNLKQIGLSLHNYHDVHKSLPPGVTVSDASTDFVGNHFGWAHHMLPWFDQGPLSEKFDRHLHLSRAPNSELAATVLKGLRCASDEGPDQDVSGSPGRQYLMGTSSYAGNFGVGFPTLRMNPKHCQGVFGPNTSVRFRDIKDGTSNVIFVGERRNPKQCGSFAAVALASMPEYGGCTFWAGSNAPPSQQLQLLPPPADEEAVSVRRLSGNGSAAAAVSLFQILATTRSGDVTDLVANPRQGPIDSGPGRAELWDTVPATIPINRTIGMQDGRPSLVAISGNFQDKTTVGFSSWHTGGCQVLLGDGTVRFISENIDRQIYEDLSRRSDGSTLGEF